MKILDLRGAILAIIVILISFQANAQVDLPPSEPIWCPPGPIASPNWSSSTNKIFSPCPQVKVGIGTPFPIDNLHILTQDEEGISFVQRSVNQRSRISFLDYSLNPNWSMTAYNNFSGGYGNIFELRSHKDGNFWIRNTTVMVGDYFDLTCADCSDYLMFVRKGIRTERLKVDIAPGLWADYVFTDDHKLLPLNEVKSYIEDHGHLPNIPSATIVEKEGIEIGEISSKLLEKIEELTLYIIEQDESIEQLKSDLKALQIIKNQH